MLVLYFSPLILTEDYSHYQNSIKGFLLKKNVGLIEINNITSLSTCSQLKEGQKLGIIERLPKD